MNITLIKAALAMRGITLRKTGLGNEIRVNYANGREATAYYTDDAQDALDTGLSMADHKDGKLAKAMYWQAQADLYGGSIQQDTAVRFQSELAALGA
jgi:hypothetical protein